MPTPGRFQAPAASARYGVPWTEIPLVHGIEVPTVRLWDVIV
jgi:hypothetical protein